MAPMPDKINIAIQPFSIMYSQQSCTQVLTTGHFKLIQHCTFKSFLMVRFGVLRVYRVVYAREHIFFKSMKLANHESFVANWN